MLVSLVIWMIIFVVIAINRYNGYELDLVNSFCWKDKPIEICRLSDLSAARK